MENLRIFDTFEDYIDYKESPDFEMPSANAVHNTQYGYDLMFIDNGINHNIISYTLGEGSSDHVFNYAHQIFGENILLKVDYKGIKYLVLDSPLHKFINSTDTSLASSGIMSIALPDTIKEISEGAFARCTNLQQVIFPKYLEKVCSNAFDNNQMQEIIIPEYVNLIEANAFNYLTSLQTLEFKSKHLENLTIESYGFCSLPYLKTIISRSKLPFILNSSYAFYDCGTGSNVTDKRFYLPFNFDEGAYNLGLFGNNNSPFKYYKVSHKISNLSGNITCTIGSTPLNTINNNIGAISHNTTIIQVPVIYGGASFYDVLGEEYITTTKTGTLNIPITTNTTFETINHTVTFCRNILNVDTGQDLVISGSSYISQWGKPRYRIEYTDDSTGWYDLGKKDIRLSSAQLSTIECRVFRNRNSNMDGTSSKMRIYFKNIVNPKFHVTNYAEPTYDYIQVSALDKTISEQISFTLTATHTINYFNNFTDASFNINDDEEHFVEVAFRKDTSTDRNYDAGYVNFRTSYINDKTFEVTEKHRSLGLGIIEHTFANPLYNGNISNTGGTYIHGLQSGVYGMNNTPVYKYNSYQIKLQRDSVEYSSKNGTNANYLLTYIVNIAKSGMDRTPNKEYIPYHKSGTTASTQTTSFTANSGIRVRGFYDNNSMYFDVKQNGFEVKYNVTNILADWNSAATDFPSWYLAINDYSTVTNAHGIHAVNVNPYTTATYAVPYTANGSTTTYTYANYAWTLCATTATKIAPQEVIPNVNFGKLYMSGNAGKNSSVSLMTIDVTGYKKFTMYARSSGESNYDYIMISKPNVSINNFMSDICLSHRSKTPTNYTYLSLKGKATSTSITKSLYSASAFTKVEFNLKDYIYSTPTCQIICAFVKDNSQNQQDDAGFIYIPN